MSTKHISQKNLDKVYRKELQRVGKSGFEEIRKNIKSRSDNSRNDNSIFLCHSHLDKTIVNKILALFQNLNIELYIDWMDTSLPEQTDRNTASSIKNKIDQSRKFLFLATFNALRSKWCNWELGLAYASKGENDFAILPIETNTGKWNGNEYLQLYPEMQIEFFESEVMEIKEHNIQINIHNRDSIQFKDWFLLDHR